jgi:hypothetical protein
MSNDVAGPDGSALSEGLGLLPQPAMLRGVDEDYYTAEQMRAYGAQERAEERERCAKLCEAQIAGYIDYENLSPDVPWEADSMGEIRMAKQCAAKIRA